MADSAFNLSAVLTRLERRGAKRAEADVREILGDLLSDEAPVDSLLEERLQLTLSAEEVGLDERERLDEDLISLLRACAQAGPEGADLLVRIASFAEPHLCAIVLGLLEPPGAEVSERDRALLDSSIERAQLRRDQVLDIRAHGEESALVTLAREEARGWARAKALPLLGDEFVALLAERRSQDFRDLVEAAATRWDSTDPAFDPLRKLAHAHADGYLDDAALEPAMRLLEAVEADPETPVSFDPFAPHKVTPQRPEQLAADRATGGRALLLAAGRGDAPFSHFTPAASADDWSRLASAALAHPDLLDGRVEAREVHVPVTSGHVLSEIERRMAPLEPELVAYEISRRFTAESAYGLRMVGVWDGAPVALHAFVDLGVNGAGSSTLERIRLLVEERRIDARFARGRIVSWSGRTPVAFTRPGVGACAPLAHLLRTQCRHHNARWVWNAARDGEILVCPECRVPLACVPLERLPEARSATSLAALDPDRRASEDFAAHALRRARFHAALAGEPLPGTWERATGACEPADLAQIRTSVLASASAQPAGRRTGLREALGARR